MMDKYTSSERKVDVYDIGDGFVCVAHSEGLDELGGIYSYSSYVRMLKANLPYLLDCFWTNINPPM